MASRQSQLLRAAIRGNGRNILPQQKICTRSVGSFTAGKGADATSRLGRSLWPNYGREIHTSSKALRDERDPGGKPIPTDGSYRTVYDDFNNITASDDPQLSVRSMGDSNFTLSDGLVCRTPIIMIQKQVMLWDAPLLSHDKDAKAIVMPSGVGWEDWNDDVWRVFELAQPRPEIIIFGTGKTVLPPPLKIRKYLNSLGIQIEAHDTRNACSTYNLLNEEQRMVAAALLPNVRQPTKRIKTSEQP